MTHEDQVALEILNECAVESGKARGRPARPRCLLRATYPRDGDDGVPWSAKPPRASVRQR
jgi:hypothetical protein